MHHKNFIKTPEKKITWQQELKLAVFFFNVVCLSIKSYLKKDRCIMIFNREAVEL